MNETKDQELYRGAREHKECAHGHAALQLCQGGGNVMPWKVVFHATARRGAVPKRVSTRHALYWTRLPATRVAKRAKSRDKPHARHNRRSLACVVRPIRRGTSGLIRCFWSFKLL